MRRRDFLKNGSLTGLSVMAFLPGQSMEVGEASGKFGLEEATLDQLQQKMVSGEYSSRSITEQYLQRIKKIDKQGPTLRAVIELNPDALTIADQLDKERKAGKIRGPLHGIPVWGKDNSDTGDSMMTTAGSLALEGHKAAHDAFVVKK